MKMLLFKIFLFLNFSLNSMQIIDYNNPKENSFNNDWELITDEVMGGISTGYFEYINSGNKGYYRLKGRVSTQHNGGFIQFRSKINLGNDSFTKIKLMVRGSGDSYQVHLRTQFTILPWQYYFASFKTSEEWNLIEIPLSEFKKSHKLQPSKFDSNEIKTLGFVAIGKDFDAQLDVTGIELN